MPANPDRLREVKTLPQLIKYLRDELEWPIEASEVEDLTYEYEPEELGLDEHHAARVKEIKQLRPLESGQPWGIFWVNFEKKRLPLVVLRRILAGLILKRRAGARRADRPGWHLNDLLFISSYGEEEHRTVSFAHFTEEEGEGGLPALRVMGWDDLDTGLHIDHVADRLHQYLRWQGAREDKAAWRERWASAFTTRHLEVIRTSRDLSIRLAGLARAIRGRILEVLEVESEKGPLTKLMKAFKESLVHDLDAGTFADMYAQTIAYGLLSARIADPKSRTADDLGAHLRTNPFLKELMATFLQAGGRRGRAGAPNIDFDELGVGEVVRLLDTADMEAVVRDFGDRNPQEDPVIHFYELFLKEYDAKKRMQRGVFYTPRPVVSYIVRSVDELLRTEFGLPDGLADATTWGEMAKKNKDLKISEGVSADQPFVQILDPACGTGTFLVEAIDLIHKTLKAKWEKEAHGPLLANVVERWNEYVPKYLLPRLHGYELLMAPYAIAHLKVGLKLKETGYRFESDERAHIYLTNALEPPVDAIQRMDLLIPALAHEAHAVNEVKRNQRFTVVIGNPPYSLHSANLEAQHRALVDVYKFINGARIQERGALQLEKNLNDDYVKFTRLAQLSVERTGFGVTGLITNHSFLDNPTMRGLRWSLLQSASRIWLNDLHGNATKQEQPPEGVEDFNVFQIKQGVAITLSVRLPRKERQCEARHHERWGFRESKDAWLATNHVGSHEWLLLAPAPDHFLFIPQSTSLRIEFTSWPSLAEIMPANGAGYITARDNLVIDFDRDALIERIRAFNASRKDDSALLKAFDVAAKKGWDVQRARAELKHVDIAEWVIKTNYRPFDSRWIFFDPTLVWGRSWPTMKHVVGHRGNMTMLATRMTKDQWDVWVAMTVSSHKAMSAYDTNSVFPLYLTEESDGLQKSFASKQRINFSTSFLGLLASSLDLQQTGAHGLPVALLPEEIFQYAYAVFHSPDYRSRYADFLKSDFPRLPLPGGLELFRSLAHLGGELMALHLLESPKLNKAVAKWKGSTPSGEVEKVIWVDGAVWVDKAKTEGFKGVPEAVWNFHIGGYQVCEKWLKDRKGRRLSAEDMAHYKKIVVAIQETIRLMKEIDEVIEKHGGWPGAFITGKPQETIVAIETPKEAALPFRKLSPKESRPYKNAVPLYSLKAAAGKFGKAQEVEPEAWVEIKTSHKLREGMFVALVIGKSMEPAIPDGSYCLFSSPVQGTRQGKILLVQHHSIHDPDTGGSYTVKKYTSEKKVSEDAWHHESIALQPLNPAFEPIEIKPEDYESLNIIAEHLEVL